MAFLARDLLNQIAAEAADAGINACVKIERLAVVTGWTHERVSRVAATLKDNDMIVMHAPGCWRLTDFGLQVAQGLADGRLSSGPRGPHGNRKPCADSFRARVWSALRIARKGTIRDLVERAGGTDKDLNNATAWLRQLRIAGYVSELKREPGDRLTSNGFKRYLLIRDTGPAVPALGLGRAEGGSK